MLTKADLDKIYVQPLTLCSFKIILNDFDNVEQFIRQKPFFKKSLFLFHIGFKIVFKAKVPVNGGKP